MEKDTKSLFQITEAARACGISRSWVCSLAEKNRLVITLEDGVLDGGFGSRVAQTLGPTGALVRCYGLPHGFPDRYEVKELLASCGMTPEGIAADALELLGR